MNTTTTRTVTVTKRDGSTKSVETPYGDVEALHHLRKLTEQGAPLYRSSFARSLCVASRDRQLTEKQMCWVHILVVEAAQPREDSSDDQAEELQRIRSLMQSASESIKYPKIDLATEGGQRVRLSRAGYRSANPGVINITDGKPFGENTFYGRISNDGKLRASRAMTQEVKSLLLSFDRDPQASAMAHGHATGNCCFCSRELTDGRSVSAGYGPVCAERYGLAWGDTN